ncbi:hypothetical protein CDAR_434801 [Caerostris darwini]|uniref:Uncharacterized protein n=1 Tax=Caerostris darwini TaxID=1538125 RepID=A0AAV4QIX9_9ARAC|nr:hypothetical protein CDAR_434801 [Caerostris darwini]
MIRVYKRITATVRVKRWYLGKIPGDVQTVNGPQKRDQLSKRKPEMKTLVFLHYSMDSILFFCNYNLVPMDHSEKGQAIKRKEDGSISVNDNDSENV